MEDTGFAEPIERGASSVEYAILISLIGVVILVAVALLGTRLSQLFDDSCSSLATAENSSC